MITLLQSLAIASHIFRYILAAGAVYLCIALFRHYRRAGWLLLGFIFLEPFYSLAVRFFYDRPLLGYLTYGSVNHDGAQEVTYRMDFPFFFMVSIVGLFLLLREVHRDKQVRSAFTGAIDPLGR